MSGFEAPLLEDGVVTDAIPSLQNPVKVYNSRHRTWNAL